MRSETALADRSTAVLGPLLGPFVRSVAVAVVAGVPAGMIAGGVGSRIAMRIVALMAGSAQQGAITEAEATVGEITAGGTFFLIFFGGLAFGAIGGLVYLAVRPWLAGAGRWRGLAFGFLLLAMFGWTVVEGDNPDFAQFGTDAANITMFGSLFVFYGVLLVPLFDQVERRLPDMSFSLAGLSSIAAHVGALALTVGLIVAIANGFGEDGRERLFLSILPGYVLLVMPAVSLLLARAAGRFQRLSDLRGHRVALVVALVVLAVPLIVGLVLDGVAVEDIMEIVGRHFPSGT